ncbi:hypothetical protein PTT_12157 [Pyrenophora teres f. teres 0-1]|uniref:Uncharacterized protein n=1 Tax=Pyrenophora teres f. teres (strain 0-1) TaxID=861557 RepID=E3RT50_PYRTT|nr:hypothetical protein PTT_12157 [Pyrenophora teres f. teres 0-1]
MTFWKIQYPPQSGPGSKVGFTNAKAILNQLSDLGVFADTDGILSNWTKEEIEEGGSITEEDAVKKDDGKHVFKKNTAITSGHKEEIWCTKGLKGKLMTFGIVKPNDG